jgi:ATP-dependent Lon protease
MSLPKSNHVAVLPLRKGALFPRTVVPFAVGRPRSLRLIADLHVGDVLATFGQRDARTLEPVEADLVETGTLARVMRIERKSEGEYLIVLEGLARVRRSSFDDRGAYAVADLEELVEQDTDTAAARDAAEALRATACEHDALAQVEVDADPAAYADKIAALLDLEASAAAELLRQTSVPERLSAVRAHLERQQTKREVRASVERQVRDELGKHQREAILREQLKVIRKELGDGDGESDADRLREKLAKLDLPEEVRDVVTRELRRLEATNGQGPESNVIRNYLELIADLPWTARAEDKSDIGAVEAQLERDHHGLAEVKRRIVEHMAVRKLAQRDRGTLLCLVGPPGVGKTSLGQSIADATGRPFVRVALGGVRDEAEIRGHRRTYVGALPGRILHALRKAKVKNPVVLLDEIDKLATSSFLGSPEAALLEVLDPEQNKTFTDHYLELPFDLSEVLFVCTANALEPLSGPLRDRLEVVELSGYTPEEKVHIARKHLWQKRATELGLEGLEIDDAAIGSVVRGYTREAGVRQLDRELTRILRGMAVGVARGEAKPAGVTSDDVSRILGKVKFEDEATEARLDPGVATGLAWTPTGGSILFIETSKMPGKGRLEITGQLGDVMKESARAALTYVRTHASELGIPALNLDEIDVHIHVPEGATPKDGPSAGVTIFSALVSLFTERPLLPKTAMTGECTLRGRVLPVGGIKSKVLAAHRAGVRRVILPKKCMRDLDDVPREVRDEMEFIAVTDMREVLDAAIGPDTRVANVAEGHVSQQVSHLSQA